MTYTLSSGETTALVVLVVWELSWKGVAMWRAAKLKAPYWFAALLILNTAGILPILYLLFTTDTNDSKDAAAT